ncbi:MAG: alkaline phosphatase family protein [Candidatus Cybelea sp.]
MKTLDFGRNALFICVASALVAGCGGLQPPISAPGTLQLPQATGRTDAKRTIKNLIVVIQEDRSFDNLFAGYPNADAPMKGLTSTGKYVRLRPITLKRASCSRGDRSFQTIYDNGKMDGWNLLDPNHPLCPYTRVERSETQPYWDLAKHFVLADRTFESAHFGDFADSIYLVAGTTKIDRRTFAVGPPTNFPWGCDAPPGTLTPVLKNGLVEIQGPFPCFTQFPSMATLLDKAHVSWKFYFGGLHENTPFNPYEAISYVRTGRDWKRNMSSPATDIFSDLSQGHLAALSWVLSPLADSDLRGNGGGPAWVGSIVRATQQSRYWKHAAIVVIWNDSGDGNFYDNVAPPQLDVMGLGFRVPMIVASPYAKRDYVSHTQYEFGSILKFIEENWNLGSLGATDGRANSIGDVFDL